MIKLALLFYIMPQTDRFVMDNSALYFLKKIFICLFMFTQLSSYAQTSVRPINGPRSDRHVTDELGRRQGMWRYYYYSSGDISEEINYVNNLKEGKNTKYFQGNKIQTETNYLGGKKDGDHKRYFLSGQVAVEGQYVYAQRDGIWTEYYEDGQIKTQREYNKGVKDGNWKSYNRKGELLSDITYKNGVDVNAPIPPPKIQPAANKKAAVKSKNYKITGATQDTTKFK